MASNNDLDDTDADLQLTQREINVIDPISKTRMTDPVRNAVCGHVYDKGSLVAMLEKNKNTRYIFFTQRQIPNILSQCIINVFALCLQMSCSWMHQHRLHRLKSMSYWYCDKEVPGKKPLGLDLKTNDRYIYL